MKTHYNIRIGTPDVDVNAPAHVAGVPEGNAGGSFDTGSGFYHDPSTAGPGQPEGMVKATPARSTGVNAGARAPIDPTAPTLTPA